MAPQSGGSAGAHGGRAKGARCVGVQGGWPDCSVLQVGRQLLEKEVLERADMEELLGP